MYNLRILSKADTEKLLTMDEVIETVESVYIQKSNDKAEVYPMVYAEFNPGVCDMDIKSGWLKDSGNYGFKLTSWYSENHLKGLPEIVAVVMVVDDKTGVPLGLLDGGHVTGMRTGAAGAIGAKYLARKDSKNLLMVGAGNIATYEIAAMLTVFPELEEVRIYDPMSYEFAQGKANDMCRLMKERFNIDASNVVFMATDDLENVLKTTDVVITVTPARTPLIKKEWLKEGTHLSCIGSDMSGKEEIDPMIFEEARVFVDDMEQCMSVGEIEIPIKTGVFKTEDIAGEMGDVILNRVEGRRSETETTVFDSTGIALMDIAVAQVAFAKANEKHLGLSVEI